MDTNKICYGCFDEHDGVGPCPHCGYDLSKNAHPYIALPIGTILNGRYLTGRVLGVGGFGITYVAFDLTLEIVVAVKEYLPSGIAVRVNDRYTLAVSSPEEEDKYHKGETRFLDEARTLAKLRDVPNIVTVQDYFRENNSAYFVMDYIDGVNLKTYVTTHGGKLNATEAKSLFMPIMESLRSVHSHNLLHRDISPDNILVMKNGTTRLIDFGAARLAVDSDKSKSIILKHGFAPEEQYRTHGNQGPWTDVYALAATMYMSITGTMPPDAIERIHEDTIVPINQIVPSIPTSMNDAIMKALAVRMSDRFQSMDDFMTAMNKQNMSAESSEMPQASGQAPLTATETQASDQTSSISTEPIASDVVNATIAQTNDTLSSNQASAAFSSEGSDKDLLSTPDSDIPESSQEKPMISITSEKPENVAFQEDSSSASPLNNDETKQKTKKSFFKSPVFVIIAAAVLVTIITIPTIYLVRNYVFSEETVSSSKSTRRTARTTETTETSETETTASPTTAPTAVVDYDVPTVIDRPGGAKRYSNEVQAYSIDVPGDYVFEGTPEYYSFTSGDGQCKIFSGFSYYQYGYPTYSLNDFASYGDLWINEFLEELGYTDVVFSEHSTGTLVSRDTYEGVSFNMDDANGVACDGLVLALEAKSGAGCHFVMCTQFRNDPNYETNDSIVVGAVQTFATLYGGNNSYMLYKYNYTPRYIFAYDSSITSSFQQVTTESGLTCMYGTINGIDENIGYVATVDLSAATSMDEAFDLLEAVDSNAPFETYTDPEFVRGNDICKVRAYASSYDDDAMLLFTFVLEEDGKYLGVCAFMDASMPQSIVDQFHVLRDSIQFN